MASTDRVPVLVREPGTEVFLRDVRQGLSGPRKTIPCKYLYDRRGSRLFDRICELDEYYPTRTELSIMRRYPDEIAAQIGPGVALVEYGSGSSVKTRWLLDHLDEPIAYVPVDISEDHLRETAVRLAGLYPAIDIVPVCADFTRPFRLPAFPREPSHAAVYFPGSTIGNFEPAAARSLLASIAEVVGEGGGAIIGFDLRKDAAVIEAAYNDGEGVTAEFNLNLLERINRELGADFEVDSFEHAAEYQPEHGRIEMSLVSTRDQEVTIGDDVFAFERDEPIHTEHSHKYTVDLFGEMASAAGMTMRRVWTDPRDWFAVGHFVVE